MNEIFTCTVVFGFHRTVAYLDGELDAWTAEDLVDRLAPMVESGRDVVVNLSGLSSVATTGLILLDRLAQCAEDEGGSLCLADPSAPARRLLDITGLATRFTIQADAALPRSNYARAATPSDNEVQTLCRRVM
jgi:anti-sigma B factor antagonist